MPYLVYERFDKPDGYLVVSRSKNGARIQFKISAQKYLYTHLRRSRPTHTAGQGIDFDPLLDSVARSHYFPLRREYTLRATFYDPLLAQTTELVRRRARLFAGELLACATKIALGESFVGSRGRRQNRRIADAAGALARARRSVTVQHARSEDLGLGDD